LPGRQGGQERKRERDSNKAEPKSNPKDEAEGKELFNGHFARPWVAKRPQEGKPRRG